MQLPSPSWKRMGHTISQMKVLSAFAWRCLHSFPSLLPLKKQALELRHLCITKIYPYSEVIVCWRGSKFQTLNREQLECMAKTRLCLDLTEHSLICILVHYYSYSQSVVAEKPPKQEKLKSDWKNSCKKVFDSHPHCSAGKSRLQFHRKTRSWLLTLKANNYMLLKSMFFYFTWVTMQLFEFCQVEAGESRCKRDNEKN